MLCFYVVGSSALDELIPHFHSKTFNVEINMLWQSLNQISLNILHHHPPSFHTVGKHCNMLNSTMLKVVEWKLMLHPFVWGLMGCARLPEG